ncbi:MAG TPA: DeoR/GlpR transcriptional regulator [Clostridiales bacterium]|jgi:DeoR family deoxyribose operon repressor|nr:DeoR/GlpR transcriptional regulator [Clostridiales bacterium]
MNKYSRQKNIVSFLKENNGASIKELATVFGVSEMTIRRDLTFLENKKKIKLVHGAAIFINDDKITLGEADYDLHIESVKQSMEKLKIGQFAASLIEPNDTIIIDTGTTTEQIAHYLPTDIPITVLCYNMNTLLAISNKPNINIILAGGYYYKNTQLFQSPEGVRMIRRIRANKAFLSASGVNQKLGVTCVEQIEVETKAAAISSSLSRILVCDSSKFDKIGPSYFAQINEFDAIITDSNIPDDWIEFLNESNIRLYTV